LNSKTTWATFYFDADQFSNAFQNEMATQLHCCFDAMMEQPDFVSENNFQLLVGKTDLQTAYHDGYGFALVEIVGPNHFHKVLTAYWKAADSVSICTSSEVSVDDVEFGWCADFNKEEILNYNVENVAKVIQRNALGFLYSAGFTNYPIIKIVFSFNVEVREQLENEINAFVLKQLVSANMVASKTSKNVYHITIDFGKKKIDDTLFEINNFIAAFRGNEILRAIEIV